MNAHVHQDDWNVFDIDPFDTIDARITEKARRLHRTRRWVFFPYGYWTEKDGAFVVFDRRYHPLARKRRDGSVQILPMLDLDRAARIEFKKQHFLYGSIDHPCDTEETQQRLIGVVRRLGLEEEIHHRYDVLHNVWAARRRNFRRLLCRR
ncbi:hypothetical protein [Bradyrhizobium sp. BWA-3-5]|uniref:hypothetical protein n=1 Tax=Bradyrhizobium sp. BWA-3-5 TaxID=3080013 RepID=UPI00293F00BB|nr:hypothetical protein [Bradyrhizobium sp. BWA-3-5]WOH68650.1 hypothetical protein RX331_13475 [Bradyrhizobium sp. BWA-3-5]